MAQREASIYLYLFIVAAVLFVAMAVMFYMASAEKQQLSTALQAAEVKFKNADREKKQLAGEIQELEELVAGPTAKEWGSAAKLKDHFLQEELKGKVEKAVNDALAVLQESPRTYTYLAEPFGDLQSLFEKLIQSRDKALAEREAEKAVQVQNKQEAERTIAKLREDKEASVKQIRDLESRYEDLDNRANAREADLRSQLEQLRLERDQQVTELRRALNFRDNEIRSLQAKIAKMQEQVRKEEDIATIEKDGTIQHVLASQGKAWIDLGRADRISKGMRFRVFQTVKGGKRIAKGTVEVQKVDERMSEVRITEESDPLNPIVAGDMIASPFYDRNARPVFVFAGSQLDSKDVTKELLVSKLESYGAIVSKDVDEKTDFIIAMKDYETTPEFRAARELQVKILRERDLLEFLGY
ncbi:MAG: BRCT domain-containing protein [Planctomycetota bacterium]